MFKSVSIAAAAHGDLRRPRSCCRCRASQRPSAISWNVRQRGRSRHRAGRARKVSGGDHGERRRGGQGAGLPPFRHSQHVERPESIFLYEVYDNEAAFKAHRETEHFKKYAAATSKMVAKREFQADVRDCIERPGNNAITRQHPSLTMIGASRAPEVHSASGAGAPRIRRITGQLWDKRRPKPGEQDERNHPYAEKCGTRRQRRGIPESSRVRAARRAPTSTRMPGITLSAPPRPRPRCAATAWRLTRLPSGRGCCAMSAASMRRSRCSAANCACR